MSTSSLSLLDFTHPQLTAPPWRKSPRGAPELQVWFRFTNGYGASVTRRRNAESREDSLASYELVPVRYLGKEDGMWEFARDTGVSEGPVKGLTCPGAFNILKVIAGLPADVRGASA